MTTTGGGGDASSSELIGVIVFLFIVVAIMFSIGLVVFLIVRKIIERNAQRKTTMTAYAQQRGLAYEGDGTLPTITPLLRRRGRASGKVSGRLPGGITGTLASYQYTVGSDDDRRTYYFTVVLAPLPEAGSTRFYCFRRVGGDLFDSIGDALTPLQTVELESELFSRSFRLMVKDEANMVAIRQLFSPSFIVFLSEEVPPTFWFEVEGGQILGVIKGENWEDAAALDGLCTTTAAVAERIRKDVSERHGLRRATTPAPPGPAGRAAPRLLRHRPGESPRLPSPKRRLLLRRPAADRRPGAHGDGAGRGHPCRAGRQASCYPFAASLTTTSSSASIDSCIPSSMPDSMTMSRISRAG